MKKFDEKVVVITGATSGIGKATAIKFATQGASVVLIGRNEEKGKEIVKEICNQGGKAQFIKCDVSDAMDVKHAANIITAEYEKIDVLFNNAGIMLPSKELERLSDEEWNTTFDVNVTGMFHTIREMKACIFACKGCIINNASIAGMQSYAAGRSYAYSASKAAVMQFSRQMAKNYASDGVRVNCICPGIIETPILGERNRADYAERIPLGYIGSPDDVANAVSFLASKDSEYITGAVIPVDWGGSI